MSTEIRGPSPPGRKRDVGIEALRASCRGPIFEPGDEGYEASRHVYNANIDRRPALVVQPEDAADVIEAVNYARDHGMAVAIRGGGHNVGGLGTCDGEMLVDLGRIRNVRVDRRTRKVRCGGGTLIGGLDHATHACGLAVPGGIISTTGVGGLTLGGGFGYLSRQHGLTCDNLCSADIVTADGELLTVDEDHHAELFWALKGAGGNFGVVTSFEFDAHPAGTIIGGPMFWPVEQAREVFERYRDLIRDAPLELGAFISFHIIPPVAPFPEAYHEQTMCGVVVCYNGPEAEAHEVLEPLRSDLPPSIDMLRPMPYPLLQSSFDTLLPRGLHHYWKSLYLRELSDEAIDVHLEHGPKVANIHTTMHMYPLNGAVHRVGPHETAFNFRDVEFAVNIVGVAYTAKQLEPIRGWAREYWNAMRPHSVGTGYVNFLMGDEDRQMIEATFGDNYDKLVTVKKQYDPENIFRINHNIRP